MSTAWPSELNAEWWDSFDVEEDWQDEGTRGVEAQVIQWGFSLHCDENSADML